MKFDINCNSTAPVYSGGCCFENWPIAMAYVPMQQWEEIYNPTEGLSFGTIFPSLNLPFMGGGLR